MLQNFFSNFISKRNKFVFIFWIVVLIDFKFALYFRQPSIYKKNSGKIKKSSKGLVYF